VLEGTETRFEESLLGSELPTDVQLSAQSKATFDKNARKDEKSGELFMGEEEFINAIAPEGEDYVSYILRPLFAAID
jgi:solute carrier family 25 (mitochondrial aspartate/glutamate transporter), member 12/13